MLTVRIDHRFDDFRLAATFEAPAGITVLFGRSGSGKSSIINAVAGLLRPDKGHITVDGRVLLDTAAGTHMPPYRRRVGYIFQEPRLFPHLTVRQNLRYGRLFTPKNAHTVDMDHIVAMLGLGGLLDRRPAGLSGGERQRVAIGRALLASPQLILADEPLAALDNARKAEILTYFELLRDEVQIPILYVSHDMMEVGRLATTVVVLQEGRVQHQGPPSDVLSNPAVTPLGAAAAGSLLETIVKAHEDDGISRLDASGLTLLVPRLTYAIGTKLRVRIDAKDVVLAVSEPRGISALNILPAELLTLRQGDGPGVMAQLRVGNARLLARITRRSAEALELVPGMQLFAVIKAVSIPRDAIGDAATIGPG